MNTLDLWKHVQWLSVDEFMCLLFGLKPGSVKFDYGKPEHWPENDDIIYKLLFNDIMSEKLHVHFQDPLRDPRQGKYFGEEYAQPGNPWWEEGKLHKSQLVKWLTEKDIPSVFFGVTVTEENPINIDETTYPSAECVTVPRSTGSRKDTARINKTRQVCEEVRAELSQEKQIFNNNKNNWIPNLLFDTGKTKRDIFMNTVQARLGDIKLHRDTAVEFWNTIPADLKHRGRVPDE